MNGNHPAKGVVSRRNGGGVWFGLRLLSLSLLAAWVTGCQKPDSTAGAPAVQARADTAVSRQTAGEVRVKTAPSAGGQVAGGTPKVVVEKDTCDLGRVGVGTKHKGQFKFTNTGSAPLKITHVESCCGVTTKGVENGQEYAPGQSGVLEFEYQTPDMPSAADKKLQLHTNDPNRGIAVLTIRADVVRRIICKPEVLRLVLKKANAGCPEIALTGLDDQPFSIVDFKATGNAITAEFDPTAKANDFLLKPTVNLAKLEQNMRGQISIGLTHPECSQVRVLFDTLPEYEISTPTIMMFGLKVGQPVQREFWVLNNYQDDFEIESVSSQKGFIKLVEQTKVNNRYQLRIEVTPPEREGDSTVASDTLEIRIKDGRTLSVPFRGFYP